MEKTQKGFIVPIIILLALGILGGGAYYFYSHTGISIPKIPKEERESDEKAEIVASSTIDDMGPTTFTWSSFVFKYPPGWVVQKMYDEKTNQEIGVSIFLSKQNGIASDQKKNGIYIDNASADCSSYNDFLPTKCLMIYGSSVYTLSNDPEILDIFESFVKTITHTPDLGITIQTPAHNDEWESGTSRTITWTFRTSPLKEHASISIIDTNGGIEVWKIADIQNSGSYDITIPSGSDPLGNRKKYGPYVVYVEEEPWRTVQTGPASYSMNSQVGLSDPFYITSSGGEPDFSSGKNSDSLSIYPNEIFSKAIDIPVGVKYLKFNIVFSNSGPEQIGVLLDSQLLWVGSLDPAFGKTIPVGPANTYGMVGGRVLRVVGDKSTTVELTDIEFVY